MRYIICGLHRTGTSALMKAIIDSSSLEAHVDPEIDLIIRSREIDPAYNPNPNGYFSHSSMFAPIADWISNTPENSVMKAAPEAFLENAGTEPISVIMTKRIQSEIELSLAQSFNIEFSSFRYEVQANAEQILNSASNVSLSIITFLDLISNPEQIFNNLALAGWPIDVNIASATIDPELKRF